MGNFSRGRELWWGRARTSVHVPLPTKISYHCSLTVDQLGKPRMHICTVACLAATV